MENKTLVLDLVEWIAERPRPYDDVMTAWRTSCPRLTIWEDAIDADLVRIKTGEHAQELVLITETGKAFLRQSGRTEG